MPNFNYGPKINPVSIIVICIITVHYCPPLVISYLLLMMKHEIQLGIYPLFIAESSKWDLYETS